MLRGSHYAAIPSALQMPMKKAGLVMACALLGFSASAAAAQRITQTQMTPSEAPQRTTATYGDWVVQCETQAQQPHEKVCDMAQVAQVQGKNLPFSRVAIAHPTKGQPVKLVVQVPVNASFSKNVRIQTGDADPGIAAPFALCTPNGCFADFDIKDDMMKKLRAASGAGRLSFAEAGGHDVTVPLSFNGFAQAFDALAKE
jgi:invasion protein IalB